MEPIAEELVAVIRAATGMSEIFRAGCSPEELGNLEKEIGVPLPKDYREFLLCFNGQLDSVRLSFPPDQLILLSAGELKALWSQLRAHSDRRFFEQFEDDDRVRAVLYDPRRIPIAHNESGGAYIFLDGVPGPRGTLMQLVFNPNESDVRVLAGSLSELLSDYLRLLRSGEMKIEKKPPAYGIGFWFTTREGAPVDFASFLRLTRVR